MLPGLSDGGAPGVDIETELRKSYLEYSLSVIIGRAIPDARDGLKPVHRRILFAQHEMGNAYNRPHKKSARVVGDVIGKYHPHGDSAVYDALVRMAQDFSMRVPLVDGQGNFGSIDNDPPAAMRYTEVRMSRLAAEFLADIGKQTVEFRPNYDNTMEEPAVLPTRVPNYLLNGTSGIAVGMATNVPPHNLGELCDALLHLLEEPGSAIGELMEYVRGPDFPTGGIVYAGKGLDDAFHTGRGSVRVRGRVEVEPRSKGGESIVIREIPYALNKAALVEKIAALVNERRIDGVADLRDESDRKGIRIVLDLKRGVVADIIINSLYKYTPLETSFAYNMLAVVGNRPQLLNLKSALECFLEHRREVVIRRTAFDLRESEAQAHVLEGLRIALDNIDAVIALIRASRTADEAKDGLMRDFALSEAQSRAILNMRLQRLTGLERDKLLEEYRELVKAIAWLKSVLENEEILRSVIRDEIRELKETFAGKRKTEILRDDPIDIEVEDLIPDEDVVITLSRRGYIKRTTLDNYQQQRRGGKGIAGLQMGEDDVVQDFLTTSNHQFLLLFTNRGRMHQLKVHQVPEGSRTAKGAHIANLLPLEKDEWVTTALTVREFSRERHFLFVTRRGMVKRSESALYARARKGGINAVGLREGDELIMVREVRENCQVVLTTGAGQAIRFDCREVRPMGRGAAGVKGIALRGEDSVVACVIVFAGNEDIAIMTVSRNGYGKRTRLELYPVQSRGGRGVINFRTTSKTGPVIGALPVSDSDALLLLTSTNKIIRIGLEEIRSIGRVTQGVRLVALDDGAFVAGFDRVDDSGEDGGTDAGREV
ncbi:MAG: DNA gyrase subunit A [Desulfovibrio sp.]|nr:DNA gyrase subunit A [Desulfovibrio sp.]